MELCSRSSRHTLLLTVPFPPESGIVPVELGKNRDIGSATQLLSNSNRTTYKHLSSYLRQICCRADNVIESLCRGWPCTVILFVIFHSEMSL